MFTYTVTKSKPMLRPCCKVREGSSLTYKIYFETLQCSENSQKLQMLYTGAAHLSMHHRQHRIPLNLFITLTVL